MKKPHRWLMRAKQDVIIEPFEFDETRLAPREIAVRTDFSAISPGTECANYLALDPDVLTPGKWCTYPWVPGYAGTGTVIAVGSGVTEYKVGDRVVGALSHASHRSFDVDGVVAPLDPAVDPRYAAYCMIFSIAMTPLELIRREPFQTVAVWGQGLIGNLVAQILQRSGCTVVGIDPVAQRREQAKQCRIPHVVDPSAPDFTDQLKAIAGPGGFDVTIDTTGHSATTVTLPEYTRRGGQLVLMTHWRSQPATDGTPLVNTSFWKGITIYGAHTNSPGMQPGHNHWAKQRHKWARIQRELAAGGLTIAPLISHFIDPSRCKEAYEHLCFDKANWWGAVVDWRE